MPRYKKLSAHKAMRWSSDLEEETVMPDTIDVIEDTGPFEPTGLFAANGDQIYRVKESPGFIKFDN